MRTEDNPLVGYFLYQYAFYRIKVFVNTIWVERQHPRPIAANIQLDMDPDDLVYGEETWRLDAIPDAIRRYERLLTQE